MDHFSKYKLQENASDDEGDQQQQQKQPVHQLPLGMGNNAATAAAAPAKVGGLCLETCGQKQFL